MSAVIGAAHVGANPIIAVDLDDEKLAFAKRFGATHVVNGRNGDVVQQIRALTKSEGLGFRGLSVEGVDFAFDCIGAKSTMEQILSAAKPGRFGVARGGTAVLVGVPTTFVIDRAGILRWRKTGPVQPGDTTLTGILERALGT